LSEEESALDLVELELGASSGMTKRGTPEAKSFWAERMSFRMFHSGSGAWVGRSDVTVAALEGAAHHNDALEFAEGGRVFVDGGADVHERTDGDQRDLAGVAADLLKQEGDGIWMRRLGEAAGFRVAALVKVPLEGDGAPAAIRMSGAADFARKRSRSFGASFGVTKVVVMPRICSSGLRTREPRRRRRLCRLQCPCR